MPVLSRGELADPSTRTQALVRSLESSGSLTGAVRIPDTVGPLHVAVDLRASQITCHVELDAPRDGRPLTRVNWLIRQMKEAPSTVCVEVHTAHDRGVGTAGLLREIRENPGLLIADPHKEPRRFRVALSKPLGAKRGRGRGSFIDSVLEAINMFYAEVMQNLRAWSATPPRLREPAELKPPEALASTGLSSQDGAEPAAADSEDKSVDDRADANLADVGTPAPVIHPAGTTSADTGSTSGIPASTNIGSSGSTDTCAGTPVIAPGIQVTDMGLA
ncbi:MAG: hypothetical protein ACRDWG_14945 [Actinomycetes bacterium]